MHANITPAEEEGGKGRMQARKKNLGKVPISVAQDAGFAANGIPCATLIERVLGFMARYKESENG